jgi:uncharacterized membrane protein YjfL (UPF0719 family)
MKLFAVRNEFTGRIPAMQQHKRYRILGFFLFILFIGTIGYNWHLLISTGNYYLEASGLAPMGALWGLALIFSPSAAFKAKPGNKKSVKLMLIIGIIGLVLGSINFYLMDHYR